MEEHIQKLHGIYLQLNARGHVISDDDLSNTLLTSVPKTWSSFITTISTNGQPIPSETLIARILDEYWAWQATSTQDTAFKVDQPTGNKGKGRQPGTMKGNCWNCSKKGHCIKDYWAKGGGKEGQALKWFKQPKEIDTTKQSNDDFVFVTNEVTYVTILASDWLADSAATTHIAWDKNIFIDC